MTNQHVAFLRAINVGGRNVKKDKLKQIFTELGFSEVDTYLASGNVIFESEHKKRDTLEAMIEEEMLRTLGFEVPTFVRTRAELKQLVANLPFEADKVGKDTSYVCFVKQNLTKDESENLDKINSGIDVMISGDMVIHWWQRRSEGESELATGDVEKQIDLLTTRRNTNTLKRLVKKYFQD